MKVIILAALPLVGFALGVLLARSSDKRVDMSRADRKELSARREFMGNLSDKTIEHSMLGDHFAVIVADMLIKYRTRERSN